MNELTLYPFEGAFDAKPDKLDEIIANSCAALVLEANPSYKVNLRQTSDWKDGKPKIRLYGEISSEFLDSQDAHDALHEEVVTTYNRLYNTSLIPNDIIFVNDLVGQSTHLAKNADGLHNGDTAEALGIADRQSVTLEPVERYVAMSLAHDVFSFIHQHDGQLPEFLKPYVSFNKFEGLRGDGKTAVRAYFDNVHFSHISSITTAAFHEKKLITMRLQLEQKNLSLVF